MTIDFYNYGKKTDIFSIFTCNKDRIHGEVTYVVTQCPPLWRDLTWFIFCSCVPEIFNNIWRRGSSFSFCFGPCKLCSWPACNQILQPRLLCLNWAVTFNSKTSVFCKSIWVILLTYFCVLKVQKIIKGETIMVFLLVVWLLILDYNSCHFLPFRKYVIAVAMARHII